MDESKTLPVDVPTPASASAAEELAALQEVVLSEWQTKTMGGLDVVAAMEATVSWRVTRPLRVLDRLRRAGKPQSTVVPSRAIAVAERLRREAHGHDTSTQP